jgi:Ca2+-binding EF-hand superfamily protein
LSLQFCFTAHTREQARRQIEAGRKLIEKDSEIRRVFEDHAKISEETEPHAHIPREELHSALSELGLEIEEGAVIDFLAEYDVDRSGSFDYEEFKQAIQLPLKPPPQHEIESVFEIFSEKSSHPPFIPPAKIPEALKKLGLKAKTAHKVKVYFNQGTFLADGKISFEELNQAILSISPLPDEQEITRVYQQHAVPGKYQYIPSENLELALEALGVVVTKDQLSYHTRIIDLNFNGLIKYNAFKHIVLTPSPAEVWAKTLPLSRLLADAMPKLSECDHLRVISSLTSQEAQCVAKEVGVALKDILIQHIGQLKSSFRSMDQQVLKEDVHKISKFEVINITKMSAGSIQHFHEGLEGRIGIFILTPLVNSHFFETKHLFYSLSFSTMYVNIFLCVHNVR